MKNDTKDLIGSSSTTAVPDSDLLSPRRAPLKGVDLSTSVDFWIMEKEGALSKSTLESYKKALIRFVAYWDQSQRPGLNPLFIRQYARELEKYCKLAPASVQALLSALRSFCSWATEEGMLLNNPTLPIKLPKLSREYRKDTLTNGESENLLETVGVPKDLRALRDHLLVSLAVRVGVREIEMHRADIGDYSRGGTIALLYLQRKGRKAKDRSVVLIEELADAVDLYLRLRGKKKSTDPLFFSERPDRKGARLSVRGIRSILTSYMRKAGIDRPRVSPHSMRHFSATNAIQNGADLESVKNMMGHASIGTTENYVHLARRLNDGAEHRVQIGGKKADLSAVKPVE